MFIVEKRKLGGIMSHNNYLPVLGGLLGERGMQPVLNGFREQS